MDGLNEKLVQYADSDILQRRLESAIGRIREGIAILFSHRGKTSSASVNNFTINDPVQTGCIAKSLTATLVAIALSEKTLRFEDSVIYFFDDYTVTQAVLEQLSNTKIYNLLNHTHGFDHSRFEILPREGNGFIDVNVMMRVMNEIRLFAPPGMLQSYSSIGPWFVAAILECVYGQPYHEILNQKLFHPLGIHNLNENVKICPSVGDELRLSAQDMMKIVNLHLHGSPDIPELFDHLVTLRTKYPSPAVKWFPVTANIYPGWIDFGGSYGQLGFGEASAGVVRFLPDQDAAIVVTATHQKLANFTLASLFKEVLQDFNSMHQPQLLRAEQWDEVDSSIYEGMFDNGKYRLLVNTATNGSLRVQVFLKQEGLNTTSKDPYIKRYFKPTANHTFISVQSEQFVCPILQFSHPQKNGLFQYINTGKFVFSRIGNVEHSH